MEHAGRVESSGMCLEEGLKSYLNGEKEMYKKDDSNHSDGTYHGSEEGEKKG